MAGSFQLYEVMKPRRGLSRVRVSSVDSTDGSNEASTAAGEGVVHDSAQSEAVSEAESEAGSEESLGSGAG